MENEEIKGKLQTVTNYRCDLARACFPRAVLHQLDESVPDLADPPVPLLDSYISRLGLGHTWAEDCGGRSHRYN